VTWRAIQDYSTESETLDSLSDFGERLFWRVLARTDSWGRMRGDVTRVKKACLPGLERSSEEIEAALAELETAGLISLYAADGVTLLQVVNFDEHQPSELTRRRGKSRFTGPNSGSTSEHIGALPPRVEESREEKSPPSPPTAAADSGAAGELFTILTRIPKPGYTAERLAGRSTLKPGDDPAELARQRLGQLADSFPKVDAVREARSLADWEQYGNGAKRKTMDGIAALRNWLRRAEQSATAPEARPSHDGPNYPWLDEAEA
jgi:hypothetical protein